MIGLPTVLPTDDSRPVKVKRRFDYAQASFDRLLATDTLSTDQQTQTLAQREATNPRPLRQQIYAMLDQLFALPLAASGSAQDVYLTLFDPSAFTKGAVPR